MSTRPSQFRGRPEGFGNWGRWTQPGGTVNLVDASRVLAGASTIRLGQVFNCARPLSGLLRPDGEVPEYVHTMTAVGDFLPGRQAAMDRIELDLHSLVNTHLDAFSHVGHLGAGFDGVPFDQMVDEGGASVWSIHELPPIAGRAVLIDIARHRGVEYLEPGDFVRPEELGAEMDVVEPGDVLLIRTGRWAAPHRLPGDPGASGGPLGDWAGLHVDCMELLADRDVALLGSDSTTDTFPSPTPDAPSIHMIAEVYLGMPLLHSMDLDAVAAACAEHGRQTFFFCVAPLLIEGGTGSPVAPVCIL